HIAQRGRHCRPPSFPGITHSHLSDKVTSAPVLPLMRSDHYPDSHSQQYFPIRTSATIPGFFPSAEASLYC
ncbi:hypothetical protein JMJ77_0003598, partial [Colletotrichum scovillei]